MCGSILLFLGLFLVMSLLQSLVYSLSLLTVQFQKMFLFKLIEMIICLGQLPWGSYENEKSSWRISEQSWSSTSYNSWCARACLYWEVCHVFLFISHMHASSRASWLSSFFLISYSVSSLAWFMSNQETSFVTLGQRVLAYPLKWVILFLIILFHCLL